ncbi:MAG: MAPEG family protein [Kordiimonadaceae bacterium]|nr:MAPEG family protein [Kordiimonadaceae bacterium]MBO6567231.1 MAPEG family protein [Kordiimonadaceae bacterium]MBO6963555.1 MAPEG family protein [Kordiimonadaceae bacterium]
MNSALIAPVLAQVGLTLVTLLVLYLYRIPALAIAKPSNDVLQDPRSLDKLPKQARFAGQNYNHQFEAPVLFYVLCGIAIVAGLGDETTLLIAWAYVGLRIVHAVVHITYNRVMHRFAVFSLSSFALIWLFIDVTRHYLSMV